MRERKYLNMAADPLFVYASILRVPGVGAGSIFSRFLKISQYMDKAPTSAFKTSPVL